MLWQPLSVNTNARPGPGTFYTLISSRTRSDDAWRYRPQLTAQHGTGTHQCLAPSGGYARSESSTLTHTQPSPTLTAVVSGGTRARILGLVCLASSSWQKSGLTNLVLTLQRTAAKLYRLRERPQRSV